MATDEATDEATDDVNLADATSGKACTLAHDGMSLPHGTRLPEAPGGCRVGVRE